LREMLADNGLSLGNVNVSSQSFQQQQQQQSQTGQGNNQRYDPFQELQRITTSAGSAGFSNQGVATITHANNGLVDIFA
jgi:flagellar hook-length control protein FliK